MNENKIVLKGRIEKRRRIVAFAYVDCVLTSDVCCVNDCCFFFLLISIWFGLVWIGFGLFVYVRARYTQSK